MGGLGVEGVSATLSVVGAVPVVAVAFRYVEVLFLAVVDGEVKGLSSRATLSGLRVEGVSATLCVVGAMPSVAVALGDIILFFLAVVDSEVQGLGPRTALGSGGIVDVGAAGGVGLTVVGPSVGVALGNGIIFLLAVVDGEVESLSPVATLCGSGVVDVCAAGGVGLSVTISPGVGVAFGDIKVLSLAVVDSEIKGLGARATLGSLCVEGVGTALCVVGAVPSVGVAFCYVEVLFLAVIDGEVEGDGLVAALRRSGVPDVVAAGSVGLSIAVGPSVSVALGDRGFVYLTVVDGEVQGFSTWATLSGDGVEDVVATGSVGLSVVGPSVGVAFGDGIVFLLAVVDGEV